MEETNMCRLYVGSDWDDTFFFKLEVTSQVQKLFLQNKKKN